MRIDGFGSPILPPVPAAPPAPSGTNSSFSTTAGAAAQAIQLEEEQKKGGGGGGGGHGHAAKKALDSIDDIAARASLNIEERKKTTLDRMRDIERMKAEMAADDQQVGEKQGGSEQQDKDAEDEGKPKE